MTSYMRADGARQQIPVCPGGRDKRSNPQSEVSQVLFRLSRWENLEYAKKI